MGGSQLEAINSEKDYKDEWHEYATSQVTSLNVLVLLPNSDVCCS
jgi:hypothetical protein